MTSDPASPEPLNANKECDGRRGAVATAALERQWRGYAAPTSLAVLSAGLGDTAETYAWLQRGV
jgi:hypothetical protein